MKAKSHEKRANLSLEVSRFMVYFAAPENDSLSSKVMNAETMITDCISSITCPVFASTSFFGLTCDGKTFVEKKGGSHTCTGMTEFLVK